MSGQDTIVNYPAKVVKSDLPVSVEHLICKAYGGDMVAIRTMAETIRELHATVKTLKAQVNTGNIFDETPQRPVEKTALCQLHDLADEFHKTAKELTAQQAFSKIYADPANRSLVEQYRRDMGLGR